MGLTMKTVRSTITSLLALGSIAAMAGAAGVQVSTDAAAEGTYGLQINLGPDCAAEHFLVLDGDDGPLQGIYEACREITASAVAVTTGQATLRAGDGVGLGDGFQVATGATVTLVLDSALNGGPTYVEDRSPIDENVYTARFSARFDDLALAANNRLDGLVGFSSTSEELFRVVLEPDGAGGFQFALEALQDGGGMIQTPPGQEIPIPAGWVLVALEWNAGDGDGQLLLGINGGGLQGLTDLDNDAARIETIRFGGVNGPLFDSTSFFQLDTYSSTR